MGRERSAFHPGPESFHSNQGRIHERRPTLSLSFFACDSAADHTWKGSQPTGHNPNNSSQISSMHKNPDQIGRVLGCAHRSFLSRALKASLGSDKRNFRPPPALCGLWDP
jgi:hypothetical protein